MDRKLVTMVDAHFTCIVHDTYIISRKKLPHVREPKTVLDSVSHAVIPGTRFRIFCRWKLDSGPNRKWGFGFLKLYAGFQRLGFRIRQIKFYGFQISQATISQIPESGFSYMGDKRLNVFDVRPLSATLG